jgi:peptide-methionine (S)-S-oxide reductase
MRSSLVTLLLIAGVFAMVAGQSFLSSAHASGETHPLPKPKQELAADKETKAGDTRTAVFAGGCVWCTEGVFRQFKGVTDVKAGYTGDSKETANYEAVCSHTTNHAESIKITYDPSIITYGQLMQIFFLAHDPTTKDRQGNDVGHQYRSAIFYQSDDEKQVAEAYIKQLDEAKIYPHPIVTTLEQFKEFYPAEAYHQDYVRLHPNQPYIVHCALPEMARVRQAYKDWLKGPGSHSAAAKK